MKTMRWMLLLATLGVNLFSQDSQPAVSYDDATSLKLKIYKLALSTNADCSAPTTVVDSTSGVQADLVGKQTFASGKIANGTYKCVIAEISKLVSVTSAACTTPATYTLCNDTQQSKLSNGSNVTCSGGTGNDQRIALYFTTLAATNTGNNVFLPPTNASDTANGVTLVSPIVFPTNKQGVIKIKKQIVSSACNDIDTPTYGFGVP
ncbi:MAG: hypothetical protein JSR44_07920 [Spirochaetes bacterium]|nr:hypothetical protein [Spirochaetota bacterium]